MAITAAGLPPRTRLASPNAHPAVFWQTGGVPDAVALAEAARR